MSARNAEVEKAVKRWERARAAKDRTDPKDTKRWRAACDRVLRAELHHLRVLGL